MLQNQGTHAMAVPPAAILVGGLSALFAASCAKTCHVSCQTRRLAAPLPADLRLEHGPQLTPTHMSRARHSQESRTRAPHCAPPAHKSRTPAPQGLSLWRVYAKKGPNAVCQQASCLHHQASELDQCACVMAAPHHLHPEPQAPQAPGQHSAATTEHGGSKHINTS